MLDDDGGEMKVEKKNYPPLTITCRVVVVDANCGW